LCRPLPDARSPCCQWGVSNPPVWTGCRPRPRPGGLLTPRGPCRDARGSRCDLRAECTRVVTQERAADSMRNALHFPTCFSTIILTRKSAITTIRIELCSTSSRLSLRSTLRAAALTMPPRSSRSHLCDGRRSSSSFLR
jgi:hypothetical protein